RGSGAVAQPELRYPLPRPLQHQHRAADCRLQARLVAQVRPAPVAGDAGAAYGRNRPGVGFALRLAERGALDRPRRDLRCRSARRLQPERRGDRAAGERADRVLPGASASSAGERARKAPVAEGVPALMPSAMAESTRRKYRGEIAAGYEARRRLQVKWKAEDRIVREMLSELPPETVLLDIPVGTGRFIPFYEERDFRVIGLDVRSEER